MKKSESGITLTEIIVVIFIIALFTIILISDFPKMLRQMALSRATYDFAQDLRKAQDLGLSGIQLKDKNGYLITGVRGYGVAINISETPTKYVIYADIASAADLAGMRTSNYKYDGDTISQHCDQVVQQLPNLPATNDCIVDLIDLSKKDPSLTIKSINNIGGSNMTSINFTPPGPTTTIDGLVGNEVGVTFKNTDLSERVVRINTSGLISIQ
jgi:Tfp pilus assembly protein FimT